MTLVQRAAAHSRLAFGGFLKVLGQGSIGFLNCSILGCLERPGGMPLVI